MLEDGIFVQGDWIADEANQDIAERFLKASFKGWVFCRDNQDECLQIVLDNGPTLGEGHQRWQLNEINALIWPTPPAGIGVMDEAAFKRTADIAKQFGVIKTAASSDSYRTDLAEAAVAELEGRRRRRDGRRLAEGDRGSHGRRRVTKETEKGDPHVRSDQGWPRHHRGRRLRRRHLHRGRADLLIGESLDVAADTVIDASGKYVLPGAVDPHTHLDMPFGGTTTIDDVESGQKRPRAAAPPATSTSASRRLGRASRTRSRTGSRRPKASS